MPPSGLCISQADLFDPHAWSSVRLFRLLLAVLSISIFAAPLDAQRGSVHVHGYTRRDGSHVAPYTRSTPRSRSYATPAPRPRTYAAPRSRPYTAPQTQRTPSVRHYRAPSARSHTYTSPNSRGRIPRSRQAKDDFLRRTGYPHGRPGYVVDHVVPLCAGGADAPSNMQWQTVEEGKVKDRQERATCARRHD